MVYYFTPFSAEKDLGKAYNDCMKLLPNDDDWGCLMDADTMFLTSDYALQINDVISRHPDAGLITCLTNRIGNTEQRYAGVMSEISDISFHRSLALRISSENYGAVKRVYCKVSGMIMLIRKSTWRKIKFKEHAGKLLGVDSNYSKRIITAGKSILVMRGIYVFHYYRLNEGHEHKSHLL